MFTQKELNDRLWDAANSSRATVDASVYKDYALALLFFKYLSDNLKSSKASSKNASETIQPASTPK
jgi:type I restriction-modification system DNA methylase subunit